MKVKNRGMKESKEDERIWVEKKSKEWRERKKKKEMKIMVMRNNNNNNNNNNNEIDEGKDFLKKNLIGWLGFMVYHSLLFIQSQILCLPLGVEHSSGEFT